MKRAAVHDSYYNTAVWQALREECKKRDGYKCTAIKCTTLNRGAGGRLIADHIVERRDGGADALYNLRTLCPTCDNRRHGKRAYVR